MHQMTSPETPYLLKIRALKTNVGYKTHSGNPTRASHYMRLITSHDQLLPGEREAILKRVLLRQLSDRKPCDLSVIIGEIQLMCCIVSAIVQKKEMVENVFFSKSKRREIAYARQLSIYICRQLTRLSYATIAAYHGGRDHTTAIHAFHTIEDLIYSDEVVRDEVYALLQMDYSKNEQAEIN